MSWIRGSHPDNSNTTNNIEAPETNKVCCYRQDFTYGTAAVNIWPIANVLGYLHKEIGDLNEAFAQTDTYCIGLGLGAHLCGFFGKALKELPDEKYALEKIIGLDPSGPIFQDQHHASGKRLDKDDAYWVEIIHTNTAVLGYNRDLGHVDFYINGGYTQANCTPVKNNLTKWKDSKCSHNYAYSLFKDLLKQNISCNLTRENDPLQKQMIGNPIFELGNLDSNSVTLKGEYIVLSNRPQYKLTEFCK